MVAKGGSTALANFAIVILLFPMLFPILLSPFKMIDEKEARPAQGYKSAKIRVFYIHTAGIILSVIAVFKVILVKCQFLASRWEDSSQANPMVSRDLLLNKAR